MPSVWCLGRAPWVPHIPHPPHWQTSPVLPGLLVPLHDEEEASSSFPLDVLSRSPPLSVSRLRLSPVGLVWAEMSSRDVWGQCKHELKVCVQASEHWGSHQTGRSLTLRWPVQSLACLGF